MAAAAGADPWGGQPPLRLGLRARLLADRADRPLRAAADPVVPRAALVHRRGGLRHHRALPPPGQGPLHPDLEQQAAHPPLDGGGGDPALRDRRGRPSHHHLRDRAADPAGRRLPGRPPARAPPHRGRPARGRRAARDARSSTPSCSSPRASSSPRSPGRGRSCSPGSPPPTAAAGRSGRSGWGHWRRSRIGYQQTALAETCAFGLILAIVGRATWRRVAVYAAHGGGRHRRLADPRHRHRRGREGRLCPGRLLDPLHPSTATSGDAARATRCSTWLLRRGVLALLVVGAWLCRRDRDPRWGLWVWAGAALLVPALAEAAVGPLPGALARPGGAGSQQPPAALTGGRRPPAPAGRSRARRRHPAGRWRGRPRPGWTGSTSSTGQPQPPLLLRRRRLVADPRRSLRPTRTSSTIASPRTAAVSAWITAHGLDGSSAVVWSADAWLYDDNQLQLMLPTPPIYNDEALLGNTGRWRAGSPSWTPRSWSPRVRPGSPIRRSTRC